MNRIARPLLSDTVPPGLVRMRVIATGLLVLMAALFFVARAFEPAHPGLGYLRSFAEAAMVGGLADWFAVTALFRHPLGLPIPHTAIVPRNKDRIGTTLASFLRANFLTPAAGARLMRRVDVGLAVGKFLARLPEPAAQWRGASRPARVGPEVQLQGRMGGPGKGDLAGRP